MALATRARRESVADKRLILPDQVLQHALLVGNLVHLVNFDRSELFNVDGSAILVSLVVVLGVVLCDLLLFVIVKVVKNGVGAKLLAPVFAVHKHFSGLGNVKLAGTEKAEKVGIVETIRITECSESLAEFFNSLLFLVGQVTDTARKLVRSSLLRVRSTKKKKKRVLVVV